MDPIKNRSKPRFLALGLSCLATFCLCGPVLAQTGPSSVVMAPEPVVLPAVGLEVQVPNDATGFLNVLNDVPTLEISPSLAHWHLLIQAPQRRTTASIDAQGLVGGDLPVDSLTERVLENLLGSYRVDRSSTDAIDSRARVLLREKGLIVGGRPASRFYVAYPDREGERVRMFTLVDAGAGQMVSFDLMCDPADEREARVAYLAILRSAQFSANTEVAVARAVALEVTEALISSLTKSDYLKAIERVHGQWARLSVPAETGSTIDDTERGYRLIRAWEGHRGEIDPERSQALWNEDDRQRGYLVQIDGRVIERAPGQNQWNTIDTRIIAFMSYDRAHEAWTANTTFRQGGQRPVVNTEFGLRNGQELHVSRRGITSNTFQPIVPPRGYISQVEFYLLPQLLVGHEATTAYGMYALTGGDESIRYRQFELERSDGIAAWRLTADLGDDARSVSLFDAAGRFLGSERGDGSTWKPTTQADLLALWQRKGLPTRNQ